MFNHIMLGTNDLEKSRQFYDAFLAALGVPAAISGAATAARSVSAPPSTASRPRTATAPPPALPAPPPSKPTQRMLPASPLAA